MHSITEIPDEAVPATDTNLIINAVAIMCAALHPDLDLVACTTVNGNVEVQYCTNNTLRALELLGRADAFGTSEVPLYVLNVTYPLVPQEWERSR